MMSFFHSTIGHTIFKHFRRHKQNLKQSALRVWIKFPLYSKITDLQKVLTSN